MCLRQYHAISETNNGTTNNNELTNQLISAMAYSPPPHTYPPLSQSAINLALPEMSVIEYEAWQDFISPPPRSENFTLENITRQAPLDWENASDTFLIAEDSVPIATRRIKGLNYLYNTSRACLKHADWYATKYAGTWLPVVEVVGRVCEWEKLMEDGIVDDPIPPENIPIPWKSYNTTPIPLLEIPPFDPLALNTPSPPSASATFPNIKPTSPSRGAK